MTKRRVSIRENKLIWEICELLPSHIMLIPDEERLDVLIDLPVGEANMLIALCSRIITTAADGRNIKLKQLEERYADQIKS
jgi:hypothetical protein